MPNSAGTNVSFERSYPNLAHWIDVQGWLEIGQDDYSPSLVRCLDQGGLVWESSNEHPTLDAALQALENALEDLLAEWA